MASASAAPTTMASSTTSSTFGAGAGAGAVVGGGRRVDVTLKLSQLQNLCKRDPQGYRAEYDAQVRRLESELHILSLTGGSGSGGGGGASATSSSSGVVVLPSSLCRPAKSSKSLTSTSGTPLQELMQFAAAVSSSSYKGQESDRVARMFVQLLVGGHDDADADGQGDDGDGEGNADETSEAKLLSGNRHRRNHHGASARRGGGAGGHHHPPPPPASITMDVRAVTFLADAALRLDRNVRQTAVSCLILMRNKGAIDPLFLLPIFFRIMAVVPDKALRELLYRHMVQDVSNLNKKTRNETLNRALHGFFHRIVEAHHHHHHHHHGTSPSGSHVDDTDAAECATATAARLATNMVAELYRRRVWTDARTVAIVASSVLSSNPAVATRALRFFLNIEEKMAGDDEARRADRLESGSRIDYHMHSKKTASRQRHVERQKKNRAKLLRRQQQEAEANGDGTADDGHVRLAHDKGVEASKKLYPAIELLRDPQGLAEAVLKRLRAPGSYKYEVKLLMMNFCTRLVGNHHLLLLPLYPFLTKYLTSHQRHVTQVLCYAVQSCHEHVPPDEVNLLLKTIAHNFITERCTEEQMAVGINAARAICARVPSVLAVERGGTNDDDGDDRPEAGSDTATSGVALDVPAFVKDLAGFANHRDRSVSIAGKSWLNFVRATHPGLLTGKARGLAGTAGRKAGVRPLRYGEQRIATGVEGADLLAEYEAKRSARRAERGATSPEGNSEPSDDDVEHAEDEDGWEDVPDGDEEADSEAEEGWEEVDDEDGSAHGDGSDREEGKDIGTDDDDSSAPNLVLHDEEVASRAKVDAGVVPDVAKMSAPERDALKQQVSSSRIFSSADFDKMRRLVERERRLRTDPREAARRKRAIARGQDVDRLSEDGDSSDESDADADGGGRANVRGVVDPHELMADSKKKRQSRAEKLEKIVAGRTKFAAKGREGGSTNVEKKRAKNFLMSKYSRSARSKAAGKGILGKRKAPKKQMNHDAKKRRRKV